MPMLGSRGGGSSRGFGSFGINPFIGGNQSADTAVALAQRMLNGPSTASATAGGTLTLNGVSLGSYDYSIKTAAQTVSSFTSSDWFTTTQDTRSAWVAVNGNLTINGGITFAPSVRKLFTVIYVNGNLTINGTVHMNALGANHSGTGSSGGATTAGAIRIVNGTYSSVTNPQIPASGGAGASPQAYFYVGVAGTAGTAGGTGGGGCGSGYDLAGGYGAGGTSFCGGAGGGGARVYTPGNGVANGGKGGDGTSDGYYTTGGGAGNPGGSSPYGDGNGGSFPGGSGSAGVVILACTGTLSGTGAIYSNGPAGGLVAVGGGAGGGGSITVLCNTNSSSFGTFQAIGGYATSAYGVSTGGYDGGAGGAGTARILTGFTG